MVTCYSLIGEILLIFFHMGFACMEASRTKLKPIPNSYLKIFLHIFTSCFIYWLIGYGLTNGKGNFFVGFPWWRGIRNETNIDENWLYESLVSAIPVTIMSGTVMELCHPITFVLNTVLLSGISQPIVQHWVWNPEGWLRRFEYTDFSGAAVVFAFAGAAGFSARLFLPTKKRNYATVVSTSLFGLGSMIAVIGFLALNCGALYRTSKEEDLDLLNKVTQNTTIAGASGCVLSALIATVTITKKHLKIFSFIVHGTFSGMIAICGAADIYTLTEAALTGLISAMLFSIVQYFFICLQEQDINEAFSVYFCSGLWAILAPDIFTKNGLLYSTDKKRCLRNLLIDCVGTCTIGIWAALWTIFILLILKLFGLLENEVKFESQGHSLNEDTQNNEELYIEALPYRISEKHKTEGDPTSSIPSNCVVLEDETNLYENLPSDIEISRI